VKTTNKLPCMPVTDQERSIITRLAKVKFMPRSDDERFAREMRVAMQTSDGRGEPLEITERQARHLVRLMVRYRDQPQID
jgi:hypothetical protein